MKKREKENTEEENKTYSEEENQEDLEDIIEETPTATYPKKAIKISPFLEQEEIAQQVVPQFEAPRTNIPTNTINEPQYSSQSYKSVYPEPLTPNLIQPSITPSFRGFQQAPFNQNFSNPNPNTQSPYPETSNQEKYQPLEGTKKDRRRW